MSSTFEFSPSLTSPPGATFFTKLFVLIAVSTAMIYYANKQFQAKPSVPESLFQSLLVTYNDANNNQNTSKTLSSNNRLHYASQTLPYLRSTATYPHIVTSPPPVQGVDRRFLFANALNARVAAPTTSFRGGQSTEPMTRILTSGLPGLKYVSFSGGFKDGRGLGNQMFNLAVVVYVAELTGRRVVMERVDFIQSLDLVFDLSQIDRFTEAELCPCYHFGESHSLAYDPRIETLGISPDGSSQAKTIMLGGFFQSWKYTRLIEASLRKYFVFKPEIWRFAQDYLESSRPKGWMSRGYVRVAIHIRRGDILTKDKIEFGYTVPERDYFQRAMDFFVKNYGGRVQFIAVSSDKDWTKENVVYNVTKEAKKINSGQVQVDIAYAFDHSQGQDMAIMAGCDHMIVSSGTYGWWGGWLAKGATVYYKDWPRRNSSLSRIFRREDYYPPSWIAM